VTSLGGCVLSIWHIVRRPEECRWGYAVYELMSRSLLCVFSLSLLISWSLQIPMADEYEGLMNVFLGVESMSFNTMRKVYKQFFEVLSHMYEELSWLKRYKVCSNFVCYTQFLQLIFYFSAHDKMAVLTRTVIYGLDDILHFLALFGILFAMLTFMVHWMLGDHVSVYATYGDAVAAQGRSLFGEFIYAGGAESLHGSMLVMYWLYATTFLLIVFYTLLNFFLAIIVDAFVEVKLKNKEAAVAKDFFSDVVAVLSGAVRSMTKGWPSSRRLIAFFEGYCTEQRKETWFCRLEKDPSSGSGEQKGEEAKSGAEKGEDPEAAAAKCDPKALMEFFAEFEDPLALAGFLRHYFSTTPLVLCKKSRVSLEETDEVLGTSGSVKPVAADDPAPEEALLDPMPVEPFPLPNASGRAVKDSGILIPGAIAD